MFALMYLTTTRCSNGQRGVFCAKCMKASGYCAVWRAVHILLSYETNPPVQEVGHVSFVMSLS